jgi:hypothetical protein
MELILELQEESEVVEVYDFDPAQLPCGLLAQYWYAILAQTHDA